MMNLNESGTVHGFDTRIDPPGFLYTLSLLRINFLYDHRGNIAYHFFWQRTCIMVAQNFYKH